MDVEEQGGYAASMSFSLFFFLLYSPFGQQPFCFIVVAGNQGGKTGSIRLRAIPTTRETKIACGGVRYLVETFCSAQRPPSQMDCVLRCVSMGEDKS